MAKRKFREYGQSWEIAAALWDGPRTISEIVGHFHSYARLLGFFGITKRMDRRHQKMTKRIEEALEELIAQGWVVQEGERYSLTHLGRSEAEKVLSDMRRTRRLLQKFLQPQTVSKVGLAVHWGLAALKLPAALLSGSVGLLNDGLDTLLDGFSSLLVYFGIRLNKERAVNIVLVLLMLGTGGFTFYEALKRFFVPFKPEIDWLTFLAAIISGLICALLWAYQRYVGLRSGTLALITQSVDSRNHVIVAGGVTAGLIASLLNFAMLDTLVGLVVAVFILKSAVELAIELVRTKGQEEVSLSRYKFGLIERYDQFRQARLCNWMLYLIQEQVARTRSELHAQARQVLDFSENPVLRELGFDKHPKTDEMISQSITELFQRGWITGDEQLDITEAGRKHLRRHAFMKFEE